MSTSTQTSCYVMVILGWGWVGWGGAMTFMSTCPHTSCYVIVMFSCTCTHTHTSCYAMVIFSCTCSHTSFYVMVIFSCTCSHTSCYAMVVFSCTHVMLRYGCLGVGLGGVGWGNDVHVNLHTHTRQEWIIIWSGRNWILKHANQPRLLDE